MPKMNKVFRKIKRFIVDPCLEEKETYVVRSRKPLESQLHLIINGATTAIALPIQQQLLLRVPATTTTTLLMMRMLLVLLSIVVIALLTTTSTMTTVADAAVCYEEDQSPGSFVTYPIRTTDPVFSATKCSYGFVTLFGYGAATIFGVVGNFSFRDGVFTRLEFASSLLLLEGSIILLEDFNRGIVKNAAVFKKGGMFTIRNSVFKSCDIAIHNNTLYVLEGVSDTGGGGDGLTIQMSNDLKSSTGSTLTIRDSNLTSILLTLPQSKTTIPNPPKVTDMTVNIYNNTISGGIELKQTNPQAGNSDKLMLFGGNITISNNTISNEDDILVEFSSLVCEGDVDTRRGCVFLVEGNDFISASYAIRMLSIDLGDSSNTIIRNNTMSGNCAYFGGGTSESTGHLDYDFSSNSCAGMLRIYMLGNASMIINATIHQQPPSIYFIFSIKTRDKSSVFFSSSSPSGGGGEEEVPTFVCPHFVLSSINCDFYISDMNYNKLQLNLFENSTIIATRLHFEYGGILSILGLLNTTAVLSDTYFNETSVSGTSWSDSNVTFTRCIFDLTTKTLAIPELDSAHFLMTDSKFLLRKSSGIYVQGPLIGQSSSSVWFRNCSMQGDSTRSSSSATPLLSLLSATTTNTDGVSNTFGLRDCFFEVTLPYGFIFSKIGSSQITFDADNSNYFGNGAGVAVLDFRGTGVSSPIHLTNWNVARMELTSQLLSVTVVFLSECTIGVLRVGSAVVTSTMQLTVDKCTLDTVEVKACSLNGIYSFQNSKIQILNLYGGMMTPQLTWNNFTSVTLLNSTIQKSVVSRDSFTGWIILVSSCSFMVRVSGGVTGWQQRHSDRAIPSNLTFLNCTFDNDIPMQLNAIDGSYVPILGSSANFTKNTFLKSGLTFSMSTLNTATKDIFTVILRENEFVSTQVNGGPVALSSDGVHVDHDDSNSYRCPRCYIAITYSSKPPVYEFKMANSIFYAFSFTLNTDDDRGSNHSSNNNNITTAAIHNCTIGASVQLYANSNAGGSFTFTNTTVSLLHMDLTSAQFICVVLDDIGYTNDAMFIITNSVNISLLHTNCRSTGLVTLSGANSTGGVLTFSKSTFYGNALQLEGLKIMGDWWNSSINFIENTFESLSPSAIGATSSFHLHSASQIRFISNIISAVSVAVTIKFLRIEGDEQFSSTSRESVLLFRNNAFKKPITLLDVDLVDFDGSNKCGVVDGVDGGVSITISSLSDQTSPFELISAVLNDDESSISFLGNRSPSADVTFRNNSLAGILSVHLVSTEVLLPKSHRVTFSENRGGGGGAGGGGVIKTTLEVLYINVSVTNNTGCGLEVHSASHHHGGTTESGCIGGDILIADNTYIPLLSVQTTCLSQLSLIVKNNAFDDDSLSSTTTTEFLLWNYTKLINTNVLFEGNDFTTASSSSSSNPRFSKSSSENFPNNRSVLVYSPIEFSNASLEFRNNRMYSFYQVFNYTTVDDGSGGTILQPPHQNNAPSHIIFTGNEFTSICGRRSSSGDGVVIMSTRCGGQLASVTTPPFTMIHPSSTNYWFQQKIGPLILFLSSVSIKDGDTVLGSAAVAPKVAVFPFDVSSGFSQMNNLGSVASGGRTLGFAIVGVSTNTMTPSLFRNSSTPTHTLLDNNNTATSIPLHTPSSSSTHKSTPSRIMSASPTSSPTPSRTPSFPWIVPTDACEGFRDAILPYLKENCIVEIVPTTTSTSKADGSQQAISNLRRVASTIATAMNTSSSSSESRPTKLATRVYPLSQLLLTPSPALPPPSTSSNTTPLGECTMPTTSVSAKSTGVVIYHIDFDAWKTQQDVILGWAATTTSDGTSNFIISDQDYLFPKTLTPILHAVSTTSEGDGKANNDWVSITLATTRTTTSSSSSNTTSSSSPPPSIAIKYKGPSRLRAVTVDIGIPANTLFKCPLPINQTTTPSSSSSSSNNNYYYYYDAVFIARVVLDGSESLIDLDTFTEVVGGTGVVGGVIGSPIAAVRGGMISSLGRALVCDGIDTTEPLPFLTNSFNLKFGDEDGQYLRGSLLSCLLVFLVLSTMFAVLTVPSRKFQLGREYAAMLAEYHATQAEEASDVPKQRQDNTIANNNQRIPSSSFPIPPPPPTWLEAVQFSHFPGVLMASIAVASEGLVASSVTLLSMDSVSDVVVGVIILTAIIAYCVHLIMVVLISPKAASVSKPHLTLAGRKWDALQNVNVNILADAEDSDDEVGGGRRSKRTRRRDPTPSKWGLPSQLLSRLVASTTEIIPTSTKVWVDAVVREDEDELDDLSPTPPNPQSFRPNEWSSLRVVRAQNNHQNITSQLSSLHHRRHPSTTTTTAATVNNNIHDENDNNNIVFWPLRYAPYMDDLSWIPFKAIEFTAGVMINILDGWSTDTLPKCIGKASGMLIISGVVWIMLVVKRPFTVPIQLWISSATYTLITLTCVLTLASLFSTKGAVSDVAEVMLLLAGMCVMVQVVVDFTLAALSASEMLKSFASRVRSAKLRLLQLRKRSSGADDVAPRSANSTTPTTKLPPQRPLLEVERDSDNNESFDIQPRHSPTSSSTKALYQPPSPLLPTTPLTNSKHINKSTTASNNRGNVTRREEGDGGGGDHPPNNNTNNKGDAHEDEEMTYLEIAISIETYEESLKHKNHQPTTTNTPTATASRNPRPQPTNGKSKNTSNHHQKNNHHNRSNNRPSKNNLSFSFALSSSSAATVPSSLPPNQHSGLVEEEEDISGAADGDDDDVEDLSELLKRY